MDDLEEDQLIYADSLYKRKAGENLAAGILLLNDPSVFSGEIIEYRDQFELIQTSHCYLARQTGEQGAASLEQGEVKQDLHEVRASSIDEAIGLLENDEPDNYEGRFIKIRDTALMKKAKELIEKDSQVN